jgi:acyl-CoA thioester hydrolase
MAKPDPALLDPARYPFRCRIEPRFGDLDVNLHINNVALASMMEEAHVQFHRASGYAEGLGGLTSMVASVTIEYLAQGSYPEPIDFHLGAEHLGRSSHTLAKLATQGERVIAFSRAVLVTVGPDGPAPLPRAFTDQADHWRLRA